MSKVKPHVTTLSRAFAALPAEKFGNLQRNVKRRNVLIACGADWAVWSVKSGKQFLC
jgi:hypothetical protein